MVCLFIQPLMGTWDVPTSGLLWILLWWVCFCFWFFGMFSQEWNFCIPKIVLSFRDALDKLLQLSLLEFAVVAVLGFEPKASWRMSSLAFYQGGTEPHLSPYSNYLTYDRKGAQENQAGKRQVREARGKAGTGFQEFSYFVISQPILNLPIACWPYLVTYFLFLFCMGAWLWAMRVCQHQFPSLCKGESRLYWGKVLQRAAS